MHQAETEEPHAGDEIFQAGHGLYIGKITEVAGPYPFEKPYPGWWCVSLDTGLLRLIISYDHANHRWQSLGAQAD